MDQVYLLIMTAITAVFGFLGRYYLKTIHDKIAKNAGDITKVREMVNQQEDKLNQLTTALELNAHDDENFRNKVNEKMEDIKEGQGKIMEKITVFFEEYGFILQKIKTQEMSK